MQLLDLTVPAHLGELPHPRIKGAHSPLKQLLLPRANLVGADLVALRQISHARLLPHRLQAIFALSAASTSHQALSHRTLITVWRNGAAARAVGMMDARTLPTCPQPQQQQQTDFLAARYQEIATVTFPIRKRSR